MQTTAPIDPVQTDATSFWKPGRSMSPDPERPRSSSMTLTEEKPIERAVSASAYSRTTNCEPYAECRLAWRPDQSDLA
jgi:hypothetical protein